MILLTGATGRVGSSAAKALSRAGVRFRALVRDPDKVAFDSDGVEVVQGDLSDSAIVEQALQGISRALIVMGNHPD
ncbi:MAG: SDR family oxidoreductase, partial [Luminiphilus sp.]